MFAGLPTSADLPDTLHRVTDSLGDQLHPGSESQRLTCPRLRQLRPFVIEREARQCKQCSVSRCLDDITSSEYMWRGPSRSPEDMQH